MLPTQTPVPAAAAAAAEAAVAAAAAAAAEAAAAAAAEVSQVFPQALPKCTLPGDSSSGEGSGGPGRTRSTAPANTGAVHTVCGAHAPSVVVVGVWVQVPLQAALQGWQRGKEGEGGEPVGVVRVWGVVTTRTTLPPFRCWQWPVTHTCTRVYVW